MGSHIKRIQRVEARDGRVEQPVDQEEEPVNKEESFTWKGYRFTVVKNPGGAPAGYEIRCAIMHACGGNCRKGFAFNKIQCPLQKKHCLVHEEGLIENLFRTAL